MRTLDEQLGDFRADGLLSFESALAAIRAQQEAVEYLTARFASASTALDSVALDQQFTQQFVHSATETMAAMQAAQTRRSEGRVRLLTRRHTLRRMLATVTTGMPVWLHDPLLAMMTAGELHTATPEQLVARSWSNLTEADGRADALADAARAIAAFRLLHALAAAAVREYPAEVSVDVTEQLLAFVELLVEATGSPPARRRARPPGRLVSASPHVTRGPGRRRPRSPSRGSRRTARAPRGAVAV